MSDIIFDIDGTLWDITEAAAVAWNKVIKEMGEEVAPVSPPALKKEFGKTLETVAKDLFGGIEKDRRNQIVWKCCQCELEVLRASKKNFLYPGVKETFQVLSEKRRLFIVSNCQNGYIEFFLEKTGLKKYITDYESNGNTGMGKGENIKLVMERNQLDQAVYVGDTQDDQKAATYAEIPFIFAKYGFGRVENCSLAINNIKELTAFT